MPVDLAIVCNSFSLGGTAKAAATFALNHDRSVVRPRAVAVLEPGVRAGELEAAGIEVLSAGGDERELARLLRGADIVHVHRAGHAEPIVPAACRTAGVEALVETNVFGAFDDSPDRQQFAAQLFISQMCALRYRSALGAALPAFYERHRTLYYPVDIDGLKAADRGRDEAHRALNLDPGRPTVVRVGRDDDRKWGDILVAMVPPLLELIPEAQVVLVGTTPHRRKQLRRARVLDRVTCIDPSSDPTRLATFFSAADVLVSASSIGESFGLSIAEAMALGVPVVTDSTPWTDNAQVEVVDNGVTGWVANHPRVFAEAVADLLANDARREGFGTAAREKVQRLWHPRVLTRQLESLFESVLAAGALPKDWSPSLAQEEFFAQDYPRLSAAQFRKLSAAEQREARVTVLRERAGWALRDLRASPLENGLNMTRMALGRIRASRS